MKSHFSFFILLTALFISLVSCEKEKYPDEPKSGDTWTYKFSNWDTLGNYNGGWTQDYTAEGFDKAFTDHIEPWVHIQETGATYETVGFPCAHYRMYDDGIYTLIGLAAGGLPVKFLPYPGTVGETYSQFQNGSYTYGATIMSTTDTLTVPYGYFSNLHRYELDYVSIPNQHLWFNDSVWFVKYEIYDSTTTGIYLSQTVELVNYTAN